MKVIEGGKEVSEETFIGLRRSDDTTPKWHWLLLTTYDSFQGKVSEVMAQQPDG